MNWNLNFVADDMQYAIDKWTNKTDAFLCLFIRITILSCFNDTLHIHHSVASWASCTPLELSPACSQPLTQSHPAAPGKVVRKIHVATGITSVDAVVASTTINYSRVRYPIVWLRCATANIVHVNFMGIVFFFSFCSFLSYIPNWILSNGNCSKQLPQTRNKIRTFTEKKC